MIKKLSYFLVILLLSVSLNAQVIISEYIEGSSNNKAVEIYNAGASAVDLSLYRLVRANNGGTTLSDSLELAGNLPAGEVYVVANASAVAQILDVADTTHSITYYNGDDFIGLQEYSGGTWTTVDVIGVLGEDPGSGWDVAGTTGATGEHTLVRKETITDGNTDWESSAGTNADDSEWEVYPQDTFEYLGVHPGSTGPQTPTEYTIAEIQVTPDSLEGDSPHNGEYVKTVGVVTAANSSAFILQDGVGAWNGIYVYSSGHSAVVGDSAEVVATVTEYNGLTELTSVTEYNVLASGVDLPAAVPVDNASANAEKYESVLITVDGYCNEPDLGYGEWSIGDTTGFMIFDDLFYAVTPSAGNFYQVTGPLYYSFGDYKVVPRDSNDVNVLYEYVSIYDIQYTDAVEGDSPYLGQTVVTSGIVTAASSSSYFVQSGEGAWHGIYVYSSEDPAVGDSVIFTAEVDEYYNLTELKNVTNYIHIDSDITVPSPVTVATNDLNNEMYEGVLVNAEGTCTDSSLGYGEWELDDGSGPIVIDEMYYEFTPTQGQDYSVTGPLNYSYGAFKIAPRDSNDISEYLSGDFQIIGAVDFESDLGDMTAYDVAGPHYWHQVSGTGADGSSGYAEMNGYPSDDEPDEDWLISPEVDFSVFESEFITFWLQYKYGDDGELTFLYSEDYDGTSDPNTATWTELSFTSPTTAETWTQVEVDLSSLEGTNTYLAFRYIEQTNVRRWDVDEIVLMGVPTVEMDFPPSVESVSRDVKVPSADDNTVVTAVITDDNGISSASLLYRVDEEGEIVSTPMSNVEGDTYEGSIPNGAYSDGSFVEYAVTAVDNSPEGQVDTSSVYSFFAGNSDIKDVKQADENGQPVYSGVYMRVTGTVTAGTGTYHPDRLEAYLQDSTAGIGIFNAGLTTVLEVGNSYTVVGKMDFYNGLMQIEPDEETDITDNGAVEPVEPTILTIPELMDDPERYEGSLILIRELTISEGTPWSCSGSGSNLDFYNGEDTITVRIDADTDICGADEPDYPVDVVGIMGQYDFNAPYDEGYQVLPRSMDDFMFSTDVEDKSIPIKYALEQNYPNPFNPSTTIKFSIPEAGMVTLKVYNILGEEVATLINRELEAAHHQVMFNASALGSGVYLYRITSGKFNQTKKMLLVK